MKSIRREEDLGALTRMSEQQTFKMVDEDKIPSVSKGSSEKWVKILRTLPRGKALQATEKDLGMKTASFSNLVKDLVRKERLPPTFRVAQRTKGNIVYVYIINSAKSGGVG